VHVEARAFGEPVADKAGSCEFRSYTHNQMNFEIVGNIALRGVEEFTELH